MIAWSNLWKAFVLKPGTARPRMLLTLWEAMLGVICWAAGHWLPWWGLAVGLLSAFWLHELMFQAYAERIARVPEADVYRVPGYVACLERWTGPVA